jgi:glycosyltransferase involved in cell wall biosynthesis
VEVLRDRIRRLLTDATLRTRLGAAGRTRFEEHFTLPLFVQNTLAVYEEVVGARPARRPSPQAVAGRAV